MGAKNRCIRVDDATWERWQSMSNGSIVATLDRAMIAYAQSETHMHNPQKVNPEPKPAYAPVTKVNPLHMQPKRPKNRACEVLGHEWTVQGLCSRCGDSK